MSLVAAQKSPVPPVHSHLHAPQQEFLATCIDVDVYKNVCPNGVPALPQKGKADDDDDSE